MRVSSINVAQPRMTVKNLKHVQNPNFQGKGGALGTILGAAVGLGVTAISGGALFWTVPLFAGSGGIGGDIYENKNKPSSDDYDYDPCYPNNHDY